MADFAPCIRPREKRHSITEWINIDDGVNPNRLQLVKGRSIVQLKATQVLFSQGTPADSMFYIQKGRAKITVVSDTGKEAILTLLSAGDFAGEEAVAKEPAMRMSTATAVSACSILKVERDAIVKVLSNEPFLSNLFLSFLVKRSMRSQADLVDHLFNCSEKRLARVLLLMAETGEESEQNMLIPEITQEALAEMIGTTRSRVSFFMNRFRERGLIDYDTRIRVHQSLVEVIQHKN
jgi:CRP/FNR family cyclic AMP-dependent transcriptional regulator